MSIALTGYRIKLKASHVVKAGVWHVLVSIRLIPIKGTEADTIMLIRADGYTGKICPQYSGGN